MIERLLARTSPGVAAVLDRALEGRELGEADAMTLLGAHGRDLHALLQTADAARALDKGDDVSFVICRNINFTNVCYVGCTFCGFSRHEDEADAYDHPMEKLVAKARDAVARGATEVCIQGGIHPRKDHSHYRDILRRAQARVPEAAHPRVLARGDPLRPPEVAACRSRSCSRGSSTRASARCPAPRRRSSTTRSARSSARNKLRRDRWVEIVTAAHEIGLRSTSTIMYGHIEQPRHIAAHLELIRDIQKRTGGFTEFVPLGFIHDKNVLFNHMHARPGASMPEDLRMIAVARLFLRPWIQNVQMSWVKMGPKLGADGAALGRERLRRHADGGVDQPRVGRRLRREPARRGDARG